MRKVTYNGDIKIIKQIVAVLNRKAPLPLDQDENVDWGTDGQVYATDGTGGGKWVTPPAAQVQSDWNEADSTKADYIKNKPSDATQSTHGLMSSADKTKLDGIASGAEKNVQSDWNEADSTSDAYIANKPTIPAAQIQSDWTQADNTQADYIKNKPTIPTVNDGTLTIQQNGTTVGTFSANQSGDTTVNLTGGGGSGGHTIEDTSGADLPQEDNLQFVGVYTRDDSVNSRTEVNIVRQMTKAAMEALSSAEQEGFIDTTDEDDDYTPISAEDVKYGNTDVESKLDALTTDVSGKVSKSGDTMTGHLVIQRAGEAYVNVKNTNTGCIAYLDSDKNGNHGVWSHGYWNGSSYTASGQWILRRMTDGRVAIDVATVIGKNNTTDTPLVVNRSNSGTVWIDFQNGGSEIGAFGVSAAKKPLFYDTSTHVLSMRTVTTLVNETANISAGGNKTYATLTASALSAYDEIWIYAEYGNVANNGSASKAQIAAAASYGGGVGATINFLGSVLETSGTISITYAFGIKPLSTGLTVYNRSVSSTIGKLLIEGITY